MKQSHGMKAYWQGAEVRKQGASCRLGMVGISKPFRFCG